MIEHEQICYIDDNPNKGIIVNYGKVRKAYKKIIKVSVGKLPVLIRWLLMKNF